MTTPISQLSADVPAPDLKGVLAAANDYTQAWQRGDLKFLPLLQENLERQMRLMNGIRDKLVHSGQQLNAQLSVRPLADIISALSNVDSDALIELAQEEAQRVLTRLSEQISLMRGEREALAASPVVDGAADKARLLKQQDNMGTRRTELAGEVERYKAALAKIENALAILEANGLQTRFNGIVPSVETLSALAASGGQAMVTAQVIGKAIESLEQALGDIVKGMQYGDLQNQAKTLRERARAEEQVLRDLDSKHRQVTNGLAALDTLPALVLRREQWDAGVAQLIQSLEQLYAAINTGRPNNAADVIALDSAFNRLFTFQKQMLAQF